jgi:hypothetical protein
MAVYIDSSGRLHHDQESGLALSVRTARVLAHISPVSVPDFNVLQQHKPSQVGLVYRCAACNAPVFLRFTAKLYSGSRVELAPNFVELERAREKFNFTYLRRTRRPCSRRPSPVSPPPATTPSLRCAGASRSARSRTSARTASSSSTTSWRTSAASPRSTRRHSTS